MQPMFKFEDYRITNIILGLLLKAKWQSVGLEPLENEYTAEIVIGFDAGTNRSLYYGTSAFAILANGQSLGWELPEAQPGEKLNGQAVLRTVANIINRFKRKENRLPKRILLLRDGIVQCDEFEKAIAALQQDNIAVDLLGVRKSGAGRMAITSQESGQLIDAASGTTVISQDGDTFRIVTSRAQAGGSARPLQVVRDSGDAPLEILARQVDRLCLLNPASGYTFSRLPYVIHFADKMAKTVQRIGEVGILQGVDRQKIFFV
jgi:argonaute-like protein implicated in RNA metabolism and viral defense